MFQKSECRSGDGKWVDMHDEVEVGERRTGNNVARVHGVFVLNEAEAIHELDLGNLACAMGVEVVLNIGLGS